MTDLDPRIQFLIDNEHRKLGWMDDGPRKDQAEHMIKTRLLSLPWQEMLDLYAKTNWEENHGRIRVIQHMEKNEEGGYVPTKYVMEQNVRGQWTKLPVTHTFDEAE